MNVCSKRERRRKKISFLCLPHRDPALLEVEPDGEPLPHEDIRVVAGQEGPLQLLQLPLGEVCPRPAALGFLVVFWGEMEVRQNTD